jgi:hypothetical protein
MRVVEENGTQKERFVGGLKLNSGLDQTDYIQGKNTMIGLEARPAGFTDPANTNTLLLGVDKENKKIVSFRNGAPGNVSNSGGKKSARAWRAALINDEGYGTSGTDKEDSVVAGKWAEWIGTPPWTIVNNINNDGTTKNYADADASTPETTTIGRYEIPETAKEILVYAREHVKSGTNKYRYNSTLVIPSVVFNPIGEDGRVFVLGGGWNSLFTGDAAEFRLSKKDGKYILRVRGMSVNNTWVGSRWFIYSR